MTIRLPDHRMKDGSRQFGELQQERSSSEPADHLATLDGARITGFLTDSVTEAWVDFAIEAAGQEPVALVPRPSPSRRADVARAASLRLRRPRLRGTLALRLRPWPVTSTT